jgi:hypothetical protein
VIAMTHDTSFCIQCESSSLEDARRSVNHLRGIGYRGAIHLVGPSPIEGTVGYRLEDVEDPNAWLLGLKLVVSGLSCRDCICLKPGFLVPRLPRRLPEDIRADPVHLECHLLEGGETDILPRLLSRGYRCRSVLSADDSAWLIRPPAADLFVELVLEMSAFLPPELKGRRDVLMAYAGSMLCGDPMAHVGVSLW